MDERFVKKLLIPSFIIVVLSTIFFYELNHLLEIFFFKKKHILVIGILSAPENFQQRFSIRKTWLQLLSDISGTAYFIIGNEICEVPQVDRVDPYSCIDEPFVLPSNATTETEFTTSKVLSKNELKLELPHFIGFSFYVREKIVVKKLGVFKELLHLFDVIQVKLFSAFDNKLLASVTFDLDMLNGTDKVLTKSIKPVLLTESYEALVKLEVKNMDTKLYPSCNYVTWESGPRVINFLQLWQEDSVIPYPYTKKSCTFVFMSYSINDLESIKNHIGNRKRRLKQWRKDNKKLAAKLKNESRTYNDLLFVNVVDVYRNLSLKMVQFYKRMLETEHFHYILKVDDDSFVDLLRVHNQLKLVKKEIDDLIREKIKKEIETGVTAKVNLPKFWWWSNFKEFWKVQHSGKWRDDQYRSASYPTFPCGGGYVINKDIVQYIVLNEQNLKYFQGEDVSIGIWLSSLPVIQYKIPNTVVVNGSNQLQEEIITKFKGKQVYEKYKSTKKANQLVPNTCEWTCSNKKKYNLPFCNNIQLSIKDMYNVWSEYIENGFL